MEWKNNKKPDWDTVFISQAYLVSQRSIDPRTCHGACWVSSDNRILSLGYNGPIRDSDDSEVAKVLHTEYKYGIMIHAEENAMSNYYGAKSDTYNSTMYITGEPCHRCLRSMIQKGIRKIVYGHVKSKCIDEYDQKASELILKNRNDIMMIEYKDIDRILNLFNHTLAYIDYKSRTCRN